MEDFFEQPRAAEMARMLVFLTEKGRANQREWDFHSGYSPRHAADLRDQMERFGLIHVERSPTILVTVTKEGEELGRLFNGANPIFKRAKASAEKRQAKS